MAHMNIKQELTTLADYYCQDIPEGSILIPEYPTSCDAYSDEKPLNVFFRNETEFQMYDHFKVPCGRTYRELIPQRVLSVTGTGLKAYADEQPPTALQRHWRHKLGKKADIRWGHPGESDKPHVVIFPLEKLRPDLHSVDPDKHYHVFSKFFIPEIPCSQARVMRDPEVEFPCVVKCAYGAASEATFMVHDEDDYDDVIAHFADMEPDADIIITEMIQDIVGNYCCQFYLTKSGEIQWIGATEQMMDEEGIWLGACVDITNQNLLEDKLKPTLVPVAQKLHEWDYFGIVGVDILTDKKGDQYVIDINPRINGSTPMLMASRVMGARGWTSGVFLTEVEFTGSLEELIKLAEHVKTGEIVIFAASENNTKTSVLTHIGVFSNSMDRCRKLFTDLFKNESELS